MIETRDLRAEVGSFILVDVTLRVPSGGYGVVIGPAGSGKTTLLETIAGVVPQTAGALRIAGRDATNVPPERRGVGLVYQHAFLFPHLDVAANIAYGARDAATVEELVARLGVTPLLARPVESLSGGVRQLVALARALARRPDALLLDEPFSALDPRRRETTRREVRRIHREWRLTVLQVTHDFAEAGLLGDVAVLLDAGRVLQSGPPDRVFREPASPYIAEFLGAENVLAGVARVVPDAAPDWTESDPAGFGRARHAVEFRSGPLAIAAVGDPLEGPGHAVIRAEEIVVATEPQPSSARNHFAGTVTEVARLGALTRIVADVEGVPLVAALTTRSANDLAIAPGSTVYLSFKAMAVHLC